MAYADMYYYLDDYNGTAIPPEALERHLRRASDQVDALTYNRIRGRGFENLSYYQQECVQKAVCAQAEFNAQYGAYADMPLSGYKIGDVSLNFAGEKVNGVATTREVLQYLGQSGLATRVV